MLFALPARADSLPTWDVTATGYFGGNGQPAETFQGNLTLTFTAQYGPLLPEWTGTVSFAGLLGNWTQNYANAIPSPADGGYLATTDAYGDEVDFDMVPYPYGPVAWSPYTPCHDHPLPVFVLQPLDLRGVWLTGGFGVFAGSGAISETVTPETAPVGTPEPGEASLLIVGIGLLGLACRRGMRPASMSRQLSSV